MFRRFSHFVIVLMSMLAISCQKEVSVDGINLGGNPTTPIATGALRMKIDGVQWTADKGAGASVIAGFVNINGINAGGKSLSITLNDTIPGSYVLDQLSFNAAGFTDSLDLGGLAYTSNGGKDTSQAGGVVVIAAIDKVNKTISGSFHFKAYRDFDSKQKKITEGVFDKLPYVSNLPSANTTDTFRVKIDNVDVIAKSITGIMSGTDIYLTGSELDLSKLVAISMPWVTSAGTYNLDAIAGTYIGIYSPISTTIMTSLSGKLTILEHNKSTKRIRGNFDFVAVDLVTTKRSTISAGYFSIVYK